MEDVGASAGEAEQRCGVGLALGASPFVVGAAGGSRRLANADKKSARLRALFPRASPRDAQHHCEPQPVQMPLFAATSASSVTTEGSSD